MTKKLNLLDATFMVAGSMIGSGIFIVSAEMSRQVGSPGWLMMLWVVAGVMTLLAAISYGELAGMMPKAGGQYVYLREAFGPLVGFLYGWTFFTVIQCGTIAAVAVGFAKFSGVFFPFFSEKHILFDVHLGSYTHAFTGAQCMGLMMLVVLTWFNARGMEYGKWILRLFTSAKLIALLGLVILGLFVFSDSSIWELNSKGWWDAASYTWNEGTKSLEITPLMGTALMTAFGLGLVGSLFSSDAWNNVTFIAGEIDRPSRNIPLSLMLGTVIVTALYILINVAYLHLLPFMGNPEGADVAQRGIQFATNDRVGVSAATVMFGSAGMYVMAALIMVSTFACNNGLILAGARVYQQMAKDGLFFQSMTRDNAKHVPGVALWIQCAWCAVLCLSGKYGDLLNYVMFAVMLFYVLTIAGLFILRYKQPSAERPYKAWGYPVLPALYMILALLFCVNLLINQSNYTVPGLIIVGLGWPVYALWRRRVR
jgi:APA family basic amino acid/polyamine antiporter